MLHKNNILGSILISTLVYIPCLHAEENTQPIPLADTTNINDTEYQFFKLGTKKDYLEAERWRIVDQVEQAIMPIYEPVRPFHGYTLPPGAFRVDLSTEVANNSGDFGSDDFYSLFFKDVQVRTVTTTLNFAYGFEAFGVEDLVAQLSIPYKQQKTSGTGHPFRIETMEMTMEGAGAGIGDISATIKKKWIDQGNHFLTVSTFTGIIFPTAEDEQEFNASQTIFMDGMPPMAVSAEIEGNPAIDIFGREAGDRFFPRVAQPGNGSWGFRFGVAATRQLERGALHAGFIYDALADNDGITPGDELRYGISYVTPLTDSDHILLDLSIAGRWKGDESFPGQIMHAERDPATGGAMMNPDMSMKMVVTDRPDFKHGNITFISPSLIFIPSPNIKVFASPSYRISEPEQGPSPEWTFSLGTNFVF